MRRRLAAAVFWSATIALVYIVGFAYHRGQKDSAVS
jgi:hypothetical protein